jgi:hypothetical protein
MMKNIKRKVTTGIREKMVNNLSAAKLAPVTVQKNSNQNQR